MNSDRHPESSVSGWPARLAPSVVPGPLSAAHVRRSCSFDVTTDAQGVRLVAEGRDVVRRAAGPTTVADEVALEVQYADDGELTVRSISVGTQDRSAYAGTALQGLVGISGKNGFRAATDLALAPLGIVAGSLLHAMLHDLPITAMVRRSADPPDEPYSSAVRYHARGDLCAGHRTDGALQQWVRLRGPRRLGIGPVAEPIADPADDATFPDLGVRRPGMSSRRRRIDIRIGEDEIVTFESMMRDSVIERGESFGVETVVHEYHVSGHLEPDRETIGACTAAAIVLPAPDCPAAVASALRLVGLNVADVQTEVRESFVGVTTCTHLNDSMWMVGAVPELLKQLLDVRESE